MKKAAVLIAVALILMCSFSSSAYSETISFYEAMFDVPEYFILMSEDSSGITWLTEDEKTEFNFTQFPNFSLDDFSYGELWTAENFYCNTVAGYDVELAGSENFISDTGSAGVTVFGYKHAGDEIYPFIAYLFSTDEYVYTFEFVLYEGGLYEDSYGINDIMNSVDISNFGSTTSVVGSDSSDAVFIAAVVGIAGIAVTAGLTFLVKSFTSSEGGNTSVNNSVNELVGGLKEIADELKTLKPKAPDIELNGKNINAFNERITIGKDDDNFARKELERERRERKNMYK